MVNHRVCGRVDARWLLGVVAVVLGACQGSSEPESEAVEASASHAPAAAPPATKADVVQLTREQRIAALRKSLARPLSRSVEGLSTQTLSNGKHAVHLEGRFGHATIVRINPDGTRERGCFDNAEHAIEFATGAGVQP